VREYGVDGQIGVEPALWTEAKTSLVALQAKGSKRFTNHDPAYLEAVGKFTSQSDNIIAGAEAHIQRNLDSFAQHIIDAFPNTAKVHALKGILANMKVAVPTAVNAGICLLNVDVCLREPSTHEGSFTALRVKYINDLDRLFVIATHVCDIGQSLDKWDVGALTEFLLSAASGDKVSTLLRSISNVATTRVTTLLCRLLSCQDGSFGMRLPCVSCV
jgi:hypothetical protein